MNGAVVQENVSASAASSASTMPVHRPPPKEVQVLLPVWGNRFVRQFLDFMLPTLLAPGNLPAVANLAPSRLILMTGRGDLATIRTHPGWRRLTRICDAEVRSIDDLITPTNHTATVTLAFARAVRQVGHAMPETCFLFLVSDYLIADGSLRTVVERVLSGASGVFAGNFQILAEEAIPLLRDRIDPGSPSISLPPRELMSWALAHLHPSTTANIVNLSFSHSAHTNRLFWRVDANTLLGKFYLMHPIAIRPEVSDFVVGSSFDYSFIPEMVPSNNVVTLTDSDHYLVIEMQLRNYEHVNLRRGPLDAKMLADSLSEWATARHRQNINDTIIFHAGDLPAETAEAIARADAFVAEVRRQLSPDPQPHRDHPYWIGSMAIHRGATKRPMNKVHWKFLLDAANRDPFTALSQNLRNIIFGRPPDVTRFHPRWPDYRLPIEYLKKTVPPNGRVLLITDQPKGASQWVARLVCDAFTADMEGLVELRREEYISLVGSFDLCWLILREDQLDWSDRLVERKLLERIGPLLKPGGSLMLVLLKSHRSSEEDYYVGRFANFEGWVTQVHYVSSSRARWALNKFMRGGPPQPFDLPSSAERGVVSFVGGYLFNLFDQGAVFTSPPEGLCSSVFIVMRPPSAALAQLPRFRYENDVLLSSTQAVTSPRPAKVVDELDGEVNVDQLWHDNTGEFPIILARYRFVGNLLAGRHDVAELASSNAIGTRVVLQDIKKITTYLFSPVFSGNLDYGYSEHWPLRVREHDILRGRLPETHDSIYCLDAIDRISHEDEDAFIRHLRDSLSRVHDILIIGSSTVAESEVLDRDTCLNSKANVLLSMTASTGAMAVEVTDGDRIRIYPRTVANLKALLDRHFHVVFVFSMVGEMIQAGAVPSAEYTFAVCCHKKA
jgi:hypothetical protein